MSATRQPVSIYDLAGKQVSADNGTTVYLVISDVPLTKTLITEADSFNVFVGLPVSQSVLEMLKTGPPTLAGRCRESQLRSQPSGIT